MKLNGVERLLMNNPVRAAMQRHVDAAHFERLGGKLTGLRVLEVGCGRGIGAEILLRRFEAGDVHAFDLDPRMVATARQRAVRAGRHVHLSVADASAVPVRDASFDAVVDFGAIHHVPAWRSAIREIRRVLRPGGRFYFMEITKQCLDRWLVRTFLDHPREDRFTIAEFVTELERCGIEVGDRLVSRFRGDIYSGVGIVAPVP